MAFPSDRAGGVRRETPSQEALNSENRPLTCVDCKTWNRRNLRNVRRPFVAADVRHASKKHRPTGGPESNGGKKRFDGLEVLP